MSNNNPLNEFKDNPPYDKEWYTLFSALCYEVFYKNKDGQRLLAALENKYFRSPVANPAKEPSWAYFHEGQNELVRSFSMGIQTHLMMTELKDKAQKELAEMKPRKGRARHPAIRPIG